MGKQKSKNQRKLKAISNHSAEETFSDVPHSFVFNRGQVGKNVQQLILDLRQAMEPFTATSLKARKKNMLKDFVAVAGPLGVTHFLIFSKTPEHVNFKFVRLPRGPTLSFRVTQYSLVKDVVSSLKKHRMHEQQFTHPPLLVLNNFGNQGMQVKLMATMFQNMFPSINVHKVNLNTIRRCILINYNDDSQTLELRHYSLKVVPVGMSKGMKKLLQEKCPNMSRWEDISELLVKGANLSESEAEQDGDHNITELPQAYAGRGNMKSQQSAVRLTEIGPRITLELVKIEEGLSDGKVLYHTFIQKTEDELKEMLARKEQKLRLKQERKKKQEGDVQRKKLQKDEHKKRSLAGIKNKQGGDGDSDAEDPGENDPANVSEDDDAEYYRQEVGAEPDKDLLLHSSRKRLPRTQRSGPPNKRFKASKGHGDQRQRSQSPGGHTKQSKFKSPLRRDKKGPNTGKMAKDQKRSKFAEGRKAQRSPGPHGKKKGGGSQKPGAFGSKFPRPGQKPRLGSRQKMAGGASGRPNKRGGKRR